MPGEWSKRVGEAGERLIQEYFKLIGWGDAQSRFDIRCIQPEKHTTSGSPRQTHGIDFLYTYSSPLLDGVQVNVIASVKFSAEPYPPSPGGLFRDHVKDLSQALACFKHSPERSQAALNRSGIRAVHDVGVLFWLNNSKESYDDLIARTGNVAMPELGNHEPVFVVDNNRIAFIFDALVFAKQFHPGAQVEFFYFDTGKNTNPLTKIHSGSALPIEFINSSVLPLRIDNVGNSGKNELMLLCAEAFTEEGIGLLVGMAQKLSGSWANKILICFPDYDPLRHSNIVQSVKSSIADKKTAAVLDVRSYETDFRTLQD